MSVSYRRLPSVDRLLSNPDIAELVRSYSREAVLGLVRRHLEEVRNAMANGQHAPEPETLAGDIVARARALWRPSPSPLINATGVILHTNLGRAPLSADAILAMTEAARTYSDLELNLREGVRGSRQAHVEHLLCQLTGAEAALVVNNNASAVLLGLAALAAGGEVIVSRGEAVEIGGGFRIPDVLRQSGAILVEVGTTNRTYVGDYESAITEHTTALLKVHASNFRITGFTHAPTTQELAALGEAHHLPVLYDLGSGCLLDTTRFGLAHEPMAQEAIAEGADLVFFSGDKLLGGPQAGIIVGRRELVQRLGRHPLARAVRMDKMSLAALTATLLHYIKDEAADKVPIWHFLSFSEEELKKRASQWKKAMSPRAAAVEVKKSLSTIGGGSLPGETLPTWVLAISSDDVEGLARRLREHRPPVIGRIEEDRLLLDPRTVMPEEEEALMAAVQEGMGYV